MSADIDNGGSIMTAVDSNLYEATSNVVANNYYDKTITRDIFRPLKAKNIVQNRGNINGERYS